MINRYASLRQGLVGCWCPSLGASGFRLIDRSGNGNHGTLTNMDPGTDWVPSGGNLALDFDGVNDYVTASDANLPSGNLLSSMAFWVFLRNTSSSGGVVGFGNTGVTLAAFRAYANLRGAGIVSVEFAGNNTAYSTTSLIPLRWYHFAVVKKPGVINQTTDIYINGVKQTLVGTSSANTPNIGLLNFEVGVFNAAYFNGQIDDIRIYNRALTPSEILLLYTGGRGVGLLQERIKHRRKTTATATNRRRRLICGANC